MKLKILLVPVSVVVALVLIIGYIYPTWFGEDVNSIKKINEEIKKETESLNMAKTRKSNAEKLLQSLQENTELELLINKYYPAYRNDEDVVSNINNLAFSEGIFLKDMKVEYKKVEQSDDSVRLMSVPLQPDNVNSNVANETGNNIALIDESGNSLEDLAKAKIKFIEVALKINGNYEQIKRFTNSLNKAGLLNNIQSFKIYKEDKGTSPSSGGESQESVSPDALTADVMVGFGYYAYANKDISTLLNSDVLKMSEFNFDEANNYKNELIGNYKQSEIGETGNQNPFLSGIAVE